MGTRKVCATALSSLGGHWFPPFSKTFCVRFPERLNILQNYKKSHSLRKEWDRIFQQKNVNAQTPDFVQENAGQM